MPQLLLRIPKEAESGFAKLLSLDERGFQELQSALEKSPLISNIEKLSSKLISTIESIPESDARDILDSIFPLYILKLDTELSSSDFAEDIIQAAKKSAEIGLNTGSRGQLKDRLIRLLDVKAIGTALKAMSLFYEHERTFQNARILTDIRPVFGQSPQDPATAAVIVHTLRIRFAEGREFKEFFIAMDGEDVQNMINVLERAKAKADSLKISITGTNIHIADSE